MKGLMKRLLLVALFGSLVFIFLTHLKSKSHLLKNSIASVQREGYSTIAQNTQESGDDPNVQGFEFTVMAKTQTVRVLAVSAPTVSLVQRIGELAVAPAKSLMAKTLESWRSRKIKSKIALMRERQLSKSDKHMLMTTLKVFLSVLRQSKIGYLIYGGSLLGSWRHHGLVPWDDDVDIFLNVRDKRRLVQALDGLENFTARNAGSRIKFYSYHAPRTTNYGWKWPYLDVQFYTGNETHIWDVAREFASTKYSRNDTFPPHIRPFEGINVLAPANSLKFLWQYYGRGSMCSTGWYQHMYERPVPTVSVPCKQLDGVYPFVHRRFVNGKMEEVLKFGNITIEKVFVDEPSDSITDPYGLNLETT